jgi:hypothetical protein
MIHETHDIKNALDLVAVGAAFGSLAQFLPSLAALASLVWTAIRIGEWTFGKWKAYRDAKQA